MKRFNVIKLGEALEPGHVVRIGFCGTEGCPFYLAESLPHNSSIKTLECALTTRPVERQSDVDTPVGCPIRCHGPATVVVQ